MICNTEKEPAGVDGGSSREKWGGPRNRWGGLNPDAEQRVQQLELMTPDG